MTTVKIVDVITPSDNQKKAGILGTVNLAIVDDKGVTLANLFGLKVVENKTTGDRFLSEPSQKVGDKYYSHFALLPGKADEPQRKLREEITANVLRVLDNGGTTRKKDEPVKATASKAPWEV